jgi:hypothetical protein
MTKMATGAGEPALNDDAKTQFMGDCRAWPSSVRSCFAVAKDEDAFMKCMTGVFEHEMAKAKRDANDAAAPADAPKTDDAEVAKKGPSVCDPALANMKRINTVLGEKDPTPEQQAQFITMCEGWSAGSRDCIAKAADKGAVEACLKALMEEETKKAAPAEE